MLHLLIIVEGLENGSWELKTYVNTGKINQIREYLWLMKINKQLRMLMLKKEKIKTLTNGCELLR